MLCSNFVYYSKMGNYISNVITPVTALSLCNEVVKCNSKLIDMNNKLISQEYLLKKIKDSNIINDIINDITLTNIKISDSNEKIIDKLLPMISYNRQQQTKIKKFKQFKRSQSF